MPTRILRVYLKSRKMNKISFQAECLFVRLIQVVDDYGRYLADPEELNSELFRFKSLRNVRDADISRWLAECEKAGLIVVYSINEKSYLEIQNFDQRTRSCSKYPSPSEAGVILSVNCPQPADNCGQLLAYSEAQAQSYSEAKSSSDSEDDDNSKMQQEPFDIPENLSVKPFEAGKETLSEFLVSDEVAKLAQEIEQIDARIVARNTVDWLPEVLKVVDREFVLKILKSFLKAGGGVSSRFRAYLEPCIGEKLGKRIQMKGRLNEQNKPNPRNYGYSQSGEQPRVGTVINLDELEKSK